MDQEFGVVWKRKSVLLASKYGLIGQIQIFVIVLEEKTLFLLASKYGLIGQIWIFRIVLEKNLSYWQVNMVLVDRSRFFGLLWNIKSCLTGK